MDALGRAIKHRLIDLDKLHRDYAKELGITDNYLSLIINGHRSPAWRLVRRIAVDLDLDLNAIARAYPYSKKRVGRNGRMDNTGRAKN